MEIQQIVLGEFATNCYIVSPSESGSCILIDPADNAKQIQTLLERKGLSPEAILLTHGHYDHLLAVPGLQSHWGDLPLYCHPLDCPKETVEYDMGQEFPTVAALINRKLLKDNQHLFLAELGITVLHTPGHTKGSVTFAIEDALFTGDTLFYRSIGRTDFAGGNDIQMMKSLKRLAELSGNYRVFPGHESITTLDEERRFNLCMKKAVKLKNSK